MARKEKIAPTLNRKDLLFPKLSYSVSGILFSTFKELGYGYQEKYYQRAVALQLKELAIPFVREAHLPIHFHTNIIGRYFVDFVIDQSLVLEMKVADEVYQSHISQVLAYLHASGLKLGLLARFTPQGVRIKRIIV